MHDGKLRIVIASGGFDPIHEGHICYLEHARTLGDRLLVGLNSDDWLIRKKDKLFMLWEERAPVLRAMRCVDEVLRMDDRDGSARDAIRQARIAHPDARLIFANGGDRNSANIPEMDQTDVEFIFGVGGDWKANSSSDVLRRYEQCIIGRYEQEMSPMRRFT